MDAASVINNAIVNVLKQGMPSMDEDRTQCLYRGAHGAKCVVGHMFPDDKYDPKMDLLWGVSPLILVKEFPDALPAVVHGMVSTDLPALQRWHDALHLPVDSLPEWRKTAMSTLPDFVNKDDVLALCVAQGVEVLK